MPIRSLGPHLWTPEGISQSFSLGEALKHQAISAGLGDGRESAGTYTVAYCKSNRGMSGEGQLEQTLLNDLTPGDALGVAAS